MTKHELLSSIQSLSANEQFELAGFYQVSVKTANEQLTNICDDGEISPEATIRKFRIVQDADKGHRPIEPR